MMKKVIVRNTEILSKINLEN